MYHTKFLLDVHHLKATTHKDTRMNSKPQLDNPTSRPLVIPIGASLEIYFFHGVCKRGHPEYHSKMERHIAASKNFITKWHKTIERGK